MLMDEADTDGDGFIDFDECAASLVVLTRASAFDACGGNHIFSVLFDLAFRVERMDEFSICIRI